MPSVGHSPYPEQLRPVLSWSPNRWNYSWDDSWDNGSTPAVPPATGATASKPASKPASKRRPLEAILWWELRRIWFNLVLLAAGLVSLILIFFILSWIPSATDGVQSVFAIFMYVISANAIYTLGWISELLWSGGDTTRTANVRPRVFRMGLMFSAGITLLPAVLAPAIWVLWGYR